jgi:branched-chain amino acid transport system ATP-binding protein
MSEPVLELSELHAGYRGVPVLRGVGLTVAAGEVVALLGANGAGKTTTLRAISGLLDVDGGDVRLQGATIAGRHAARIARLGVAHVPESRGLFPGLTVRQHLQLGARRRRLDAWVLDHFPPLRDLLERRAGLLSGGEQQMLALARALVTRPRLLLVDEMSQGLAPVAVKRMLPTLRRVAEQDGTAVLLVEQHVHVALEVADRGYVLRRGRVELTGAASVLRRERDLLAESYVGAGAAT